MRVRVAFTIDNFDAQSWAYEYGLSSAKESREDLISYLHNSVLADLEDRGFLIKGDEYSE